MRSAGGSIKMLSSLRRDRFEHQSDVPQFKPRSEQRAHFASGRSAQLGRFARLTNKPLRLFRRTGSSYDRISKTALATQVLITNFACSSEKSATSCATTRHAARSSPACGAEEYRCPSGKPASIWSRMRLATARGSFAHMSGGIHGSTVCTSSPDHGHAKSWVPVGPLVSVGGGSPNVKPSDINITASYEGYAYLQAALAALNIISVSVGLGFN
jgi:hypothetical protein